MDFHLWRVERLVGGTQAGQRGWVMGRVVWQPVAWKAGGSHGELPTSQGDGGGSEKEPTLHTTPRMSLTLYVAKLRETKKGTGLFAEPVPSAASIWLSTFGHEAALGLRSRRALSSARGKPKIT